MLFILDAASGARISELLGLEIGKHISSDCTTLCVKTVIRLLSLSIAGQVYRHLRTLSYLPS